MYGKVSSVTKEIIFEGVNLTIIGILVCITIMHIN